MFGERSKPMRSNLLVVAAVALTTLVPALSANNYQYGGGWYNGRWYGGGYGGGWSNGQSYSGGYGGGWRNGQWSGTRLLEIHH